MQNTSLLEDQPIAWTPTPEVIERARLTEFMRQVGVSTWDELYEFSIRDVERFTEEVLKFLDIKFDPPYEKLLDTSEGIEFPVWFSRNADANDGTRTPSAAPDDASAFEDGSASGLIADEGVRVPPAGLNITEMCLDRWQTEEMKDQPAVIWEGEDGLIETLTYKELFAEVNKCSSGLRANGLGKSDAIGIHLPMIPETVIALLAVDRIGAIAVPVFSGYGVEAIVSRMNAVGAKALFTSTGFQRRGKQIRSAGPEAAGKCPTVGTVFLIPPRSPKYPHRRTQNVPKRRTKEQIEESRKEVDAYLAMSEEEKLEYLKQLENNFRDSAEKINSEERESMREPAGARIAFGINDIKVQAIDHPSLLMFWDELLNVGSDARVEPTSAEDPLIILYTSGTTGKPKGIAHTHASFPIKAAQDMAFGTDVGKGTRISWYTDIGWMMGPWLIYGALINGATICIYDGAPDYPTPDRMWEFCAKHKVEILGISPTLVRALAAAEGSSDGSRNADAPVRNEAEGRITSSPQTVMGDKSVRAPFERHDLSSLRIFASTGEPWNPAPWWWLFEKVGNSKLPIINYSGGTEIAGGILMGNPLLPIKPCSFSAPCPGMDIDIVDEDGNSVGPGKVGELVIKQPWIGMARGFWQEKERYLDTYWRRFKDIWVHGDWAMRDADGHWFILGRSDDTLKVAGKRVGPAEVESLLVAHPLVTEAAVIGVPDEVKGTAMVAFCVLRNADALVRNEAERNADALLRNEAEGRTTAATFENKKGWHDRGYLPHFDGVVTQFVTFRLADSLPQELLKKLEAEIESGEFEDKSREYRKRVEEYLDSGIGECILRIPEVAAIVQGAIFAENGRSCDLKAWIIMPNHAHVLLRPYQGHSLSNILKAIKSVSAHKINELLRRHGSVWQPDYFDRYIRDAEHFNKTVRYIHNNPVKAGLCSSPDEWAFSSASPQAAIADEGVRVPSVEELKALVAKDMGKPLAPSKIHFVSALPKTRNAKVMRRVIRAAYLGEDPGDLSALENPGAVDEIKSLSVESS